MNDPYAKIALDNGKDVLSTNEVVSEELNTVHFSKTLLTQ